MRTLYEVLAEANSRQAAVGHFNISDLVGLKAVYEAAKELDVPVFPFGNSDQHRPSKKTCAKRKKSFSM